MANWSNRRYKNPEGVKTEKAIGSWRAHFHQGPVRLRIWPLLKVAAARSGTKSTFHGSPERFRMSATPKNA